MTSERDHGEEIPDMERESEGKMVHDSLSLSKNEVLFIDDRLALLIVVPEDQPGTKVGTIQPLAAKPGVPGPYELIEKIALAVLFTTDPDNAGTEATVDFDESELYVIREIADSNARIGDEPVGYNLKRKIYEASFGATYRTNTIGFKLLSEAGLLTDPCRPNSRRKNPD